VSTLKELVLKREAATASLSVADEVAKAKRLALADIDAEIGLAIGDAVKVVRTQSGKDTGTVDVLVQGVMVKHNVPKKVVWDQEKLAGIKKLIKEHGDEPDYYMDTTVKTTYKVAEKVYEKMDPEVRAIFSQAREVRVGDPVITFEIRQ